MTKEKLEVNLSGHSDVFNDHRIIFDGDINFVYGENGTGKTTIAVEINSQFSDKYNIYEFKDFTKLVGENGRLNAISLGQVNAELQEKINKTIEKINKYKKLLAEPEKDGESNIYSSLKNITDKYNAQQAKIDKAFQVSASIIKNMADPQVALTNYNKNSFADDIPNASLLSEKEYKILKETASIKKKNSLPEIIDIACNPLGVLATVNSLLIKKVTPSVIIKELVDNQELRNFAQRGVELHSRGDKCAFCGNIISDDRWNKLDSYFNDEVSKLKELIQNKINKIDMILSKISNINVPKSTAFYPELEDEANQKLLSYNNELKEIEVFLNSAKKDLENKKDNLFDTSHPLTKLAPKDISEATKSLNNLIAKNNDYTNNLSQKISNAKIQLRLHLVKQSLNKIHYNDEKILLLQIEEQKKNVQKDYDEIKRRLSQEEESLKSLYDETKDESAIANMINATLASNRHSSFTLKLAKDNTFGQSGQYNVIGRNGAERNITELSTGEKNTVAILYFLYSLEADIKKDSNSPFIIIIDDPVNSNDDTMQYMIMSEIKKLCEKDIFKNKSKFVILSHNTHFFINIRPYGSAKYGKRYSSFNLITGLNEKTDVIKITGPENDLKTNYDTLWINLVSGYLDNNPDNMLNNARRICGSFAEFNRIDINDFYGDGDIKKMLDVNSHEISGEEMRAAGTNAARLKQSIEQLFCKRGFKDHFENHWSFAESIISAKKKNNP